MASIFPFIRSGVRRMEPTASDVAQYFLSAVDEGAGSVMTHLKLQKLCYYAQAWSLVFDKEPLFADRIEAWVHGPVVPTLWDVYKGYGSAPIPRPEDFDASAVFTSEQLDTLAMVWDAYGCYDGKYLENLSHSEEPWIIARKGYAPDEACNVVIKHDTMVSFYSKYVE